MSVRLKEWSLPGASHATPAHRVSHLRATPSRDTPAPPRSPPGSSDLTGIPPTTQGLGGGGGGGLSAQGGVRPPPSPENCRFLVTHAAVLV